MNEILEKIRDIDKNNDFIKYILKRIKKENYRGVHFSQHNRKDFDFLKICLEKINLEIGNNYFEIPRGDFKKNFILNKKFSNFLNIVKKIKKESGKMTINSFKKNILVDFNRMGFIDRFDKNKNKTLGGVGIPIYYSKLNKYAFKFLNSNNLFEKYGLFSKGLDLYFGNFFLNLANEIYDSKYKYDKLTIYEFMFILSDKNKNLNKIELLNSYRSLNRLNQMKIIELIKKYANPKNFQLNKKSKRDFHNWKNQAQDIFTLLKTTIYFEVDNEGFKLNVGNLGVYDSIPKRNQTSKQEYFLKHKIKKNLDFELHHIIPFSEAKNKFEARIIDNYKNFIYLKKSKHKEFDMHNNKNIIMDMRDKNVKFYDFEKNMIIAKNNLETKYNYLLKKKLNKYNSYIIKEIYKISNKQEILINDLKIKL